MVINNNNNLLFISDEMRHGTKINYYHITQHTYRDDEENQHNINVIEIIIINMIHK